MNVKFNDYNLGYRVVSLALDENTRDTLISQELSFVYLNKIKNELIIFPEKLMLFTNNADLEKIYLYNNYDVFEIWENGVFIRKYNDQSNDNYFFITGKCNSNCIMCPSSEYSRRISEISKLSYLLKLAKHIPSDVRHMTITGGEPFLMGESIFIFLQYLKEKFEGTEFLFLTNGRVFAINRYFQMFCETVPCNSIVAIPIHGSSQKIHDSITRADGSFKQTEIGIKRLLKHKIPVEIRLVVSKLNVNDFDNIAELIVKEFKGIEYVSIIAMEMTGTARVNLENVWISYKESFRYISNAINIMIKNEIDVKLYNFPLCTIDKPFWVLCEKSISDTKVRFADDCNLCRYKKACSGVFAGTLQLEKEELRPVL